MTDMTVTTATVRTPVRTRSQRSLLAAVLATPRRVWRSYTAHLAADPFLVPNGRLAQAASR